MNKEENKLSGEALNLVDLNYFLYGCADPDMPNPKYMDAPEMEYFRQKVNLTNSVKGKIIITSTPADTDNGMGFYKQWWDKK